MFSMHSKLVTTCNGREERLEKVVKKFITRKEIKFM